MGIKKDLMTLISLIVILAGVCIMFIYACNEVRPVETEEIPVEEGIVLHEQMSSFDRYMENKGRRPVEVIAHRGFSSVAPDNTVGSFTKAITAGCDQIKLDVQMTKDGAIVVFHDMDLSYITGEKGKIGDYYFSEVSNINVGSYYGYDDFQEENIPRLQDALDLVKNRDVKINLELKNIGKNETFVRRVVGLVTINHLEDKVIFSSFRYDYLEIIKSIDPDLKTEYVSDSGDYEELVTKYPADYYNLRFTNVTKSTVDMLHYYSKKVFVWTVNDVESMKMALDMDVDGVVTNCPDLLEMVVASY